MQNGVKINETKTYERFTCINTRKKTSRVQRPPVTKHPTFMFNKKKRKSELLILLLNMYVFTFFNFFPLFFFILCSSKVFVVLWNKKIVFVYFYNTIFFPCSVFFLFSCFCSRLPILITTCMCLLCRQCLMSIINNIVLSIENRGQEKRIQKKNVKTKEKQRVGGKREKHIIKCCDYMERSHHLPSIIIKFSTKNKNPFLQYNIMTRSAHSIQLYWDVCIIT